jgi:hypothetical protein
MVAPTKGEGLSAGGIFNQGFYFLLPGSLLLEGRRPGRVGQSEGLGPPWNGHH